MNRLLFELGAAILATVTVTALARMALNRRTPSMDAASKRALVSSVTLLVAVVAGTVIASGRSETIRTDVVDGAISFLPSLVVGVLIFTLGYVASRLVGIATEQALRQKSPILASRLKSIVSLGLLLVSGLVALKQMGVETDVLLLILAATLATGTIAAGLAIGLGSLPLARQVAAGRHVDDRLRVGLEVTVAGRSGTIKSINLASVSVRDESGNSWEIPNLTFLDGPVEIHGDPDT